MRTEEHLGGFVQEGDPATYFPELWRFLVEEFDVSSVLDIGCGAGISTRFFASLGCEARGVDGIDAGVANFDHHDYATGPHPVPLALYDLGWCCEFLEHIEERHLPNLVSTFRACRILAITHAFPGQQGHYHVNCRTPDYWLGFFAAIGFRCDEELTRVTRAVSAANTDPYNHYLRSGMVLVRT